MIRHNFAQGSPAWMAHRATCWNAGDAAAMLACSPNETRSELLDRLHSGVHKEFSDYVQEHVLDPGHEFEDKARLVAEELIGEDLGRVVGSLDVGLSRPLGASFDGLTFMDDIAWEHKSINDSLRYTPWDEGNGEHLPKHYRVQMEQQMMVSGAERVLFMATKWNGDTLDEKRQCWYVSNPALRAEILAGWKQLEADLAVYVPGTPEAAKPAGKAPESLPALRIVITGEVSDTNLDDFKEIALTAIRSVNRDLKTDQDFADSAKARKWCEDIESKVDGAKQHALSQTASIDALFRALDEISAEARVVRLDLEKLEKARTAAINTEIVVEATAILGKHIRELSAAMPGDFMPNVPADFAGAIKGLRSVSSKRNAVDAELLRAKIAASDIATRIHANVRLLDQHPDHAFLFHDRKAIVLKASDDLQALITARIAEHKAAEAKREEEQRERIRAEELRKMALSEIQGIQQQVTIAAIGRAGVRQGGTIECIQQTLAETEAWPITEEKFGALTSTAQAAKDKAVSEIRTMLATAEEKAARLAEPVQAAASAPAPVDAPAEAPAPAAANVVPLSRPAPVAAPADNGARLKLGDINSRLAPVQITADGLAELGFQPVAMERGAKFYRTSDFPLICNALIERIAAAQTLEAA